MALPQEKPLTYLKFDSTTGIYKSCFVVQLSNNNRVVAQPPVDTPSTRTRTLRFIIQNNGGPANGFNDVTFDNNPNDPQNPFDPTAIDNIVIEVRDSAGNLKGKSTTNTNEADASGGGDDLLSRYNRLTQP